MLITESIDACPFCGAMVPIEKVNAPKWHSADKRLILQYQCQDNCGTMLMDTVVGGLELDSRIVDLLNDASLEEMQFLSRNNRAWIDDVVYGPWLIGELLTAHRVAVGAIERFGFTDAHVFSSGGGLDHGNTLLVIETTKGRFTLRVYGANTEKSEVCSEVYWLNSLNRSANIRVPVPVRGLDGSQVQKVDFISGSRYCTAYDWIKGERLQAVSSSARTPQVIRGIGKNLAAMHNHAETCVLPTWFNRPTYGIVRLRQNLDTKPQGDKRHIIQQMENLGESRDVFGLIHYESGPCNILVNGNSVAFIDFRPFGWGYYLFDVASIMRDLQVEEREIYLEAYHQVRKLPPNHSELLSYFDEVSQFI